MQHRRGGAGSILHIKDVGRGVVGERERRRAKRDRLGGRRRQCEGLAADGEVLSRAVNDTIGGDGKMGEVRFALVISVSSGRIGGRHRRVTLGEGRHIVGQALLQEHTEIVPALRAGDVVKIGADRIGGVGLQISAVVEISVGGRIERDAISHSAGVGEISMGGELDGDGADCTRIVQGGGGDKHVWIDRASGCERILDVLAIGDGASVAGRLNIRYVGMGTADDEGQAGTGQLVGG